MENIYTVYAEHDDMTFVMEEKAVSETEKSVTVIGWYYGEPDITATCELITCDNPLTAFLSR